MKQSFRKAVGVLRNQEPRQNPTDPYDCKSCQTDGMCLSALQRIRNKATGQV